MAGKKLFNDMEKAYDLTALVAALKAQGLDIAEESAGKLYETLKAWIQVSAPLSENAIDDIAGAFIGQLDQVVLPQIDRIDGVKG